MAAAIPINPIFTVNTAAFWYNGKYFPIISQLKPASSFCLNFIHITYFNEANPFSKYAIISSICSMPMDRRIVLGLMPYSINSSGKSCTFIEKKNGTGYR